jgi:hypothetical protein
MPQCGLESANSFVAYRYKLLGLFLTLCGRLKKRVTLIATAV